MKRLFKYTGESRLVNFDFTRKVITGAIISSPSVSAAPAGLTLGSPSLSGMVVQTMVSGGIDRATYVVTAQVGVDNGEILVLKALVTISDQR